MARFGGTAALHVVGQVQERIEAPRAVGVEAQLAGRQLRAGLACGMAAGRTHSNTSGWGSEAVIGTPARYRPGIRHEPRDALRRHPLVLEREDELAESVLGGFGLAVRADALSRPAEGTCR